MHNETKGGVLPVVFDHRAKTVRKERLGYVAAGKHESVLRRLKNEDAFLARLREAGRRGNVPSHPISTRTCSTTDEVPQIASYARFNVVVTRWAYSTIDEVLGHTMDGREASIGLFGDVDGDTITIDHACGPGDAHRTASSVKPDIAYFRSHERAHGLPWRGDLHSHPGDDVDRGTPSAGDLRAWTKELDRVQGSVYVGMIVSARSDVAPLDFSAWTVMRGDDGRAIVEPANLEVQRYDD